MKLLHSVTVVASLVQVHKKKPQAEGVGQSVPKKGRGGGGSGARGPRKGQGRSQKVGGGAGARGPLVPPCGEGSGSSFSMPLREPQTQALDGSSIGSFIQ